MNFLSGMLGAVPGIIAHNPALAVSGFLNSANGGQTATSAVGGAGTSNLTAEQAWGLDQQQKQQEQNIAFQAQLGWQSEAFNEMTDQKSETMREGNVLRDIAMQQRKADNAITKEFIQMIKD